MSAQRCKRPIDLLRQHGAGQFVWERHGRKREQQIGLWFPGRWQTGVPANQKYDIATAAFGVFDESDEPGSVHLLAGRVEKNFPGRRMFLENIEARRRNLAHFTRGVS